MAEFKPFSGLRYNSEVVGNLEAVVAPPYDVINATDVETLHASSPYNVTHLTRPVDDHPYDSAASTFDDWKAANVLLPEEKSIFYVYRQKFTDPDTGNEFSERVGIIGLLKLEDYSTGKVLPHENTLTAARVDRLSLLRKTQANFESIYGLYSDPDGAIAGLIRRPTDPGKLLGYVQSAIGSSHTLEELSDPEAIETISKYLENVPIFIADGHHRYETSLGFAKERDDLPGSQYILITLTALEDAGLLVLPTHRLLHGFGAGEVEILPARLLEKGFDVTVNDKPYSSLQPQQFVLILPDTEYLISLPKSAEIDKLVPGSQSAAWKALDVSLLHTAVIGDILGVPLEQLSTTNKISYTRDAAEAKQRVAAGEIEAAIVMGRPTVAQMKDVSEAGDKMPQKSTFFYPKLLSGLVLYDLERQAAQ